MKISIRAAPSLSYHKDEMKKNNKKLQECINSLNSEDWKRQSQTSCDDKKNKTDRHRNRHFELSFPAQNDRISHPSEMKCHRFLSCKLRFGIISTTGND